LPFFISSGSLAIAVAKKKTKALVKASFGFSILSSVTAFSLLTLSMNGQATIFKGSVGFALLNRCSVDGVMFRCTSPLKPKMYPDGIVWRRVRMDFKDLSVATPQEELAEKCAELMDGLRCFDRFRTECLEAGEQRTSFNYGFNTFKVNTQVLVDLCRQMGHYQTGESSEGSVSGESIFFEGIAGLPALIMFIVTTISAIKSGIRIFYIGLPESPQII